jgi:hypothetical protein
VSKSKSNTAHKIIAILLMLVAPLFFFKEYKSFIHQKIVSKEVYSEIVLNSFDHESNKPFVIFVFSDDNLVISEENLKSISSQNYSFYRLYFVDFSSSDINIKRAKHLVRKLGIYNKSSFFVAKNSESFQDLFFRAIKNCHDEDIIVQIEASDSLANSNVLEKLNKIYEDPDVWLTYSGYKESQSSVQVKSFNNSELKRKSNLKMQSPWIGAHFKTYYAGLTKQVDISSISCTSEKNSSEDIMRALECISKWHIRFIPDALYVRSGPNLKFKNFNDNELLNVIFNPLRFN